MSIKHCLDHGFIIAHNPIALTFTSCPFCLDGELGQAFIIGHIAHSSVKHKRKYSGIPYFSHPMEVALRILSQFPLQGSATEMAVAALLHDVVEDTGVDEVTLRHYFREEIVDIVMMVTKVDINETGPRAERKALDHAHYARGNAPAQTLKCMDLEHNGEDLLAQDRTFAKVWFAEAKILVGMLDKADPTVRTRVAEKIERGLEQLNT